MHGSDAGRRARPRKEVPDVSRSLLDGLLAEWHARLVAGDVAARDRICALLLPVLLRRLPHAPVADLRVDAAHDALIAYFSHPERFNPALGGLEGFVLQAARWNLANALRAHRRRLAHEEQFVRWSYGSGLGAREDRSDRLKRIARIWRILAADPHLSEGERQAIRLVAAGEWRTKALAPCLDGHGLPLKEQQRLVKQFRDRLLKRAIRLVRREREREGDR